METPLQKFKHVLANVSCEPVLLLHSFTLQWFLNYTRRMLAYKKCLDDPTFSKTILNCSDLYSSEELLSSCGQEAKNQVRKKM